MVSIDYVWVKEGRRGVRGRGHAPEPRPSEGEGLLVPLGVGLSASTHAAAWCGSWALRETTDG